MFTQNNHTTAHGVSSIILTCLGAVGVCGTAVMSAKATPKAIELWNEAEEEKGSPLTFTEKAKTGGLEYLPAAGLAFGTIACIFGAQASNQMTQASLVSAYAFMERSYHQYKDKVHEVFGKKGETRIHKAMVKEDTPEKEEFINSHSENMNDQQMFYDLFSGTYFASTLEQVEYAEKEVEEMLATNGYVYLNDFYTALNCPDLPGNNEFGWYIGWPMFNGTNEPTVINFENEFVETDDHFQCYIISAEFDPITFQVM